MAGAHLPFESLQRNLDSQHKKLLDVKILIWGLCFSSSLYSVKLVLLTVPLVVASGFMGLEFQLGFMELFFLGVLLGSNSTSSVSSVEGSGAQLDEIDWRLMLVGGIIRVQEEDISGESC
ncbi:hypothetical protein RHSIM_Rhsim06G0185500 [Rhododendron simsii]|uniref:Uncharacterized protein n=1 Tax=Rhododendron simsii TaxID=118357 RepID=A0A834LMM6_RHOSS|nr:hypothetical protein RHSIM_Rhsim06G0185500 [Rhododendron simsii]